MLATVASNEDGTKLWGWNDARGAFCARCKERDIDHIILRDFTAEQMQKDREDETKKKNAPANPRGLPREPPRTAGAADATAANPDRPLSLSQSRYVEPVTPMQVFELEPGVPDPLAINAYRDAERDRNERLAAERQKAQEAAAARAAEQLTVAADEATGDENERFKAEVERMVAEQLAKEKMSALAGKGAEVAAGNLSVSAMLKSLGLEKYIDAFEEEGMEMSVLIELAKSEDGKLAVDEALKEVGVKSVGHRLKIFAALQA